MAIMIDRFVAEALELPAEVRIGLAERILASLNTPIHPELDRFWAEEAERRISEIEQKEVALVPGEEVFERIRQKYTT